MTLASVGDDESHPSIGAAMLTEAFHPAASAVATAAIATHPQPIATVRGLAAGHLLPLLDIADMNVSSAGSLVSFGDRRADIAPHYGAGSRQVSLLEEARRQTEEASTWRAVEPAPSRLMETEAGHMPVGPWARPWATTGNVRSIFCSPVCLQALEALSPRTSGR